MFAGCSPVAVDSTKHPIPMESSFSASGVESGPSLEKRISQLLDRNLSGRRLSAETNAAWQIMHGVLAYRDQLPLEIGSQSKSALEHLFHGGVVNGWDLSAGDQLPKTKRLGMKARLEPGSYIGQGHVDQWLGIFAQIDLPLSTSIEVGSQTFTLEDWARQAQYDVSHAPVKEYSWTIMALMHYFPDEHSWIAKDGKTWTFEPLIDFEVNEDLRTSPCGGMHRMMGLAHAVRFRQRHGETMTGAWQRAQNRIDEVVQLTKRFQNEDGSFSSNFTERPGQSKDLSVMISATGHTLEFLAFALPTEELSAEWMVNATLRLCTLLEATQEIDLDCGGLYHALNGLKIYQQRRFGRESHMAER